MVKSAMDWMIENPIAANLATLGIALLGFLSFPDIVQETTPSFTVDEITIEVDYPGATPVDIEQGIILPIEHELRENNHIDRISAEAEQGSAAVSLELMEGVDPHLVLAEVKNSIDEISSFPGDMERPTVRLVQRYDSIAELAIHGNLPELTLYRQAVALKQALLEGIDLARVDMEGNRAPEIVIEMQEQALRRYGLTLEAVADVVRRSVNDIPAGQVTTRGGEVLIRTLGRREQAAQFNDMVIIADGQGGQVLLGEIATIREDFQGTYRPMLINGQPGLVLTLYQNKSAKPLDISESIREFTDDYRATLPAEMGLTMLYDEAESFKQRIGLLLENGVLGILLVILTLSLLMDIRLAFWVSMGVPISILATFCLMPWLGIPINMVTLFAFVITLGILVDDGVLVAERIYAKIQAGHAPQQALKEGAREMALPVVFSVGTNIIAFVPLLFVPGQLGVMYKPMTLLIFAIFAVSMIEALLILPFHLRSLGKPGRLAHFEKSRKASFALFERLRDRIYRPVLTCSINHPVAIICLFSALSLLVFSWMLSGRVETSFTPKIESTRIDAEVEFPNGIPDHQKMAVVNHLERAGLDALAAVNGSNAYRFRLKEIGDGSAQATFRIVSDDQREFTAREFVAAWRERVGAVPGVKSIFFDYQVGPGGEREISVELGHRDREKLTRAVHELMSQLGRIPGVTDVDSALIDGVRQLELQPNQLGRQLGFTPTGLGRQMRRIFHGEEAHRQIIAGDEVKVRVMRSRDEQYQVNKLEDLILTAPNNQRVTVSQVADITTGLSAGTIQRVDGIQIIEVTASLLHQQANSNLVFATLRQELLPQLAAADPDLEIELGGEARVESRVNQSIVNGIALAFSIIFFLLAVIFRSYLDALLTLAVIPFCLTATLLGHILLGYPLSAMSMFGMIALAGLVINGAFVLLLQIKQQRNAGSTIQAAVTQSALDRFRPVVLTALTTSVGLFPMLFETSTQALYLIPMVISQSFGTLFSMATILILSPALFTLSERWHARGHQKGTTLLKETST